jgi:hypothetical protein
MQQGIRRGLHIDEDDGGQKYEYGGILLSMKVLRLAVKEDPLKKD